LTTRTSVIGTLLLLATAITSPAQDDKDAKPSPTPNYYPLQEGNEWHYRTTADDKTGNVTTRVAKLETIGGTHLARLEAVSDGDTAALSEHLRQSGRGVYRHRFNGLEVEPPFPLLKYPIKAGAEWKGKSKAGKETIEYTSSTKEESIEVPAGKFKTVRVDLQVESAERTVRITYWFADQIGIVKQTADLGPISLVAELEKYNLKMNPQGRPQAR
jgi:hypothetical protein